MFSSLSDRALEKLAETGSREKFSSGDMIFEEGSTGDSLYLLLTGEALVHKLVDKQEGERLTIGTLQPGDLFGEMALFEHLPRSATVIAQTDVTTFSLSRKVFEDLLVSEPTDAPIILRDVITTLSHRLREAREELRVIYEISKIVASVRTVVELGDHALDELLRDIPAASYGLMAAWPEFSDDATVVSAFNLPHDKVNEFSLPRKSLLASEMKRSRDAFLLSHLAASHPLRWMLEGNEHGGLLAAPMMVKDDLLGFLVLGRTQHQRFAVGQVHLMSTVANQVAVAFAHAVSQQYQAAQEKKGRVFYGKQV